MPDKRESHGECPHCGAPQVIVVPASGQQTVWWVIAVCLAVIATALFSRWELSGTAMGQVPPSGPSSGPRGIYAFTGQLGPKNYGLFMMDVDTGTLWCYEMARGGNGEFQLQLVAARSWIFDRFLEEFNVAKPTPSEVQMMVRQQRGHAALAPGLFGGAAGSGGLSLPSTAPAGPSGSGAPPVPALPSDEQE